MKVEINLDETRFKDLIDSELEKFTDEEIHDILSKLINQYVMESDIIQRLFYNKKKDYYGKETGELEPTYRLENIVKKVNMDSTLEKLEKNIQEVLDKDETISLLAENIFYRVISQRITDMIWNSNTLYQLVTSHANNLINNAIGNNR